MSGCARCGGAGHCTCTHGAFGPEDFVPFPNYVGSLLAAVFNPPSVPGEYRFEQRWVPRLDEDGLPVVDEFGEPEMVPEVSPSYTMTVTAIPRFTGVLAYLGEDRR